MPLAFLFSGIGRKLAIYGGIALAVLLVVCGIYGAGGRAADAAATRKALDRTLKNVRTRKVVRQDIAAQAREGVSAVDQLRERWSRD